MTRWLCWVDRNPWLPLLHGSDGLTGRRRLQLAHEYASTLARVTARRKDPPA